MSAHFIPTLLYKGRRFYWQESLHKLFLVSPSVSCRCSFPHLCFLPPLHRHGGPGSCEIAGGRRSLQGFTDLTQRHASTHCLCKYSVNKHWLSVSGAAAGLVICVPCRRTCRVQVSDPLARVGCNLRRAHGLPSLVFRLPQLLFTRLRVDESTRHNAGGNAILSNLLFSPVSVWMCEWAGPAAALCRRQSALTSRWKDLSD